MEDECKLNFKMQVHPAYWGSVDWDWDKSMGLALFDVGLKQLPLSWPGKREKQKHYQDGNFRMGIVKQPKGMMKRAGSMVV